MRARAKDLKVYSYNSIFPLSLDGRGQGQGQGESEKS